MVKSHLDNKKIGCDNMKLEKISDTQVRVVLNKSDLLEREIKISELAYGSDKAQKLFKDMMEKAHDEFGFDADNTPLMIEAVPLSTDSIMIIVTKVDDPDEMDEKLANISSNKNIRKFKKKNDDDNDDVIPFDNSSTEEPEVDDTEVVTAIYMFNELDHVIDSTKHIETADIASTLYKDEKNSKLYLVLEAQSSIVTGVDKVLIEYGHKMDAASIRQGFLQEHADIMISERAVNKLQLI